VELQKLAVAPPLHEARGIGVMNAPAVPYSIRMSTEAIPEGELREIAHEVFCREILRVDMKEIDNVPYRADLTLQILPQLKMVNGWTQGIKTARTKSFLSDGVDDVYLAVSRRGQFIIRQRDVEADLAQNTAFLGSLAELGDYLHVKTDATRIMVPRKAIAAFVPDIDDRLFKLVPAQNEALRLLLAYTATLEAGRLADAPGLAEIAVNHMHDLFALAVGATGDAAHVAARRGLRAARLQAIKSYIKRRIGPSAISAEEVAARHGISPRYVRKLFESEGTSFTNFVLEQRLLRAWRMLRAPLHGHLTVSAIAYDAGFGDLSYFNRVFRRRFGDTPSAIRSSNPS
jgi:AraC-like DNA-binding protein